MTNASQEDKDEEDDDEDNDNDDDTDDDYNDDDDNKDDDYEDNDDDDDLDVYENGDDDDHHHHHHSCRFQRRTSSTVMGPYAARLSKPEAIDAMRVPYTRTGCRTLRYATAGTLKGCAGRWRLPQTSRKRSSNVPRNAAFIHATVPRQSW